MVINDLHDELEKGTNATSKRNVRSDVNCGCTLLSNVILNSDCDCDSHIKNSSFHKLNVWAIERTC